MAKLSKDELLEKVRTYVGDRTDDETLAIIEDISDSFDASDAAEWRQKFEENDKMWRDKYISRFFEKNDDGIEDPTDEKDDEEKEYKNFEDLFEEEEI